MWMITVRSPVGEPKEYPLHPGDNTIGRMPGNDIVILDPSASRYHAKLYVDEKNNTVVVHDLGSTNGTYVSSERLTGSLMLRDGDAIRIGQHQLELLYWGSKDINQKRMPQNTQHLTRDLILESLDRHAILLAEVASRLNNIMDLGTALSEVSNLMKDAMAADRCEVLLPEQFQQLSKLGFASSIAQQAIEQLSAVVYQDAQSEPSVGQSAYLLRINAAMCVPVISGKEILGLIYIFKNRAQARPFGQRDIQLAVAIAHQTALTIQRMQLMEQVHKEEVYGKLLQRFLSPQEAKYVLEEYFETGQLPSLSEMSLTVLAADICDSTGMSERLGARRFGRLLSRYYQELTEVVFEHGGLLNKYIGDGLMAVFGMPYQPENPEERAVLTAIGIIKRLEVITGQLGEHIEIGIGVNSGPTMAGYLGGLEYVEFTVLGYPINIAWGLEGQARPNRILIGHPTYQAVNGKFEIRRLGPINIKKQLEPILAYEVFPN
ncbi:MAG: adenylate/guanylate cyclase domain-containing protein [Chloroflexota bacterium]